MALTLRSHSNTPAPDDGFKNRSLSGTLLANNDRRMHGVLLAKHLPSDGLPLQMHWRVELASCWQYYKISTRGADSWTTTWWHTLGAAAHDTAKRKAVNIVLSFTRLCECVCVYVYFVRTRIILHSRPVSRVREFSTRRLSRLQERVAFCRFWWNLCHLWQFVVWHDSDLQSRAFRDEQRIYWSFLEVVYIYIYMDKKWKLVLVTASVVHACSNPIRSSFTLTTMIENAKLNTVIDLNLNIHWSISPLCESASLIWKEWFWRRWTPGCHAARNTSFI